MKRNLFELGLFHQGLLRIVCFFESCGAQRGSQACSGGTAGKYTWGTCAPKYPNVFVLFFLERWLETLVIPSNPKPVTPNFLCSEQITVVNECEAMFQLHSIVVEAKGVPACSSMRSAVRLFCHWGLISAVAEEHDGRGRNLNKL